MAARAEEDAAAEGIVPIRFIRIESMIGMFLSRLFPGFLARSHGALGSADRLPQFAARHEHDQVVETEALLGLAISSGMAPSMLAASEVLKPVQP